MENTPDKEIMIPLIAHEGEMARLERIIRRLWITILVCLAIIVGTNAAWLYYEAQFTDEITETIETSADGGGNAYGTIISGDGSEVNYGKGQIDADKAPNP